MSGKSEFDRRTLDRKVLSPVFEGKATARISSNGSLYGCFHSASTRSISAQNRASRQQAFIESCQ
jgi:hypothetical protein